MRVVKQIHENEGGQSIVEFLLTFAFSFSLIFMFIRLALNYTEGYVVHYATYMASRSYLVHDNNASGTGGATAASDRAAKLMARRVLTQVYPQLEPSRLTIRPPSSGAGSSKSLFSGVYYEFDQEFTLPFSAGGPKTLNMRSESFLGREPTRQECLKRICDAMDRKLGVNSCDKHMTLADNGC